MHLTSVKDPHLFGYEVIYLMHVSQVQDESFASNQQKTFRLQH